MTLTCTTCEPFSNRSDSGISSLRQTWRLEFATATGVDASAVTVNFADVSVAVTSITVRIAVPAATTAKVMQALLSSNPPPALGAIASFTIESTPTVALASPPPPLPAPASPPSTTAAGSNNDLDTGVAVGSSVAVCICLVLAALATAARVRRKRQAPVTLSENGGNELAAMPAPASAAQYGPC